MPHSPPPYIIQPSLFGHAFKPWNVPPARPPAPPPARSRIHACFLNSFSLLCPPASTCGLQQGDRGCLLIAPPADMFTRRFYGRELSGAKSETMFCRYNKHFNHSLSELSAQSAKSVTDNFAELLLNWDYLQRKFFRPEAAFEYSLFVKESPGLLNNWRCQLYFSILQIVSHFVTVSRPWAFRHQRSTVWRRDSLRMTWILGA